MLMAGFNHNALLVVKASPLPAKQTAVCLPDAFLDGSAARERAFQQRDSLHVHVNLTAVNVGGFCLTFCLKRLKTRLDSTITNSY
jgi:hypothetical protein